VGARKDVLAAGGEKLIVIPDGVKPRTGVDEPKRQKRTTKQAYAMLKKRLSKAFNLRSRVERRMIGPLLENLGEVYNLEDDMAFEEAMKTVESIVRVRKVMSPPGTLKLPPLLEERRWEYGITDGAFAFQPFHDRIALHQTPQWKGEASSPEGEIVLAPIGKKRERESNPEGVLVGAGLQALDELRSNGIDLGHQVTFIRQAPWRKRVDLVDGHEYHVLLLRVGDLIGSLDLANFLREGRVKIGFDEKTNEHYYIDENKKQWYPARVAPNIFTPEDY
jgi:hypothetical protein